MEGCTGFVPSGASSRSRLHLRRPSRTQERRRTAGRWFCASDSRILSRRDILVGLGSVALSTFLPAPKPALANGLKQFPLTEPLLNRYFFLRAGESPSDATGTVATNPVDKLSVKNALTKRGREQVLRAGEKLLSMGVGPDGDYDFWVWADTASKATETAEVLMDQLHFRRDHLVPEYAFLDARGMGILEGESMTRVINEVHTADARDALWRMELGEDGTPNESIHDVFVRMRQLLSKTETFYQSCDMLIISPDSYTLSVLESALRNDDLRNYTKYSFQPGELREIRPMVTKPLERKFLKLDETLEA